jgi:hypothetical protein
MSEEESSNVNDTIKAVTGLVKEVPIYQDVIQPVAKETGKTLQTIGKVVNSALLPVRGLVWGIEKFEDFIKVKVEKKLEHTPIDEICSPNLSVAGPAFESLKYAGHEETLREMYANLLANAMDINTKDDAHPSFVEIIKQLSSQEAKLLLYLSRKDIFPEVCTSINKKTSRARGSFFDMMRNNRNTSNQVKNEFLTICSEFTDNMDLNSALDNYRRLQILDIEIETNQSIDDNIFGRMSSLNRDKISEQIELSIKTTEKLFFTNFGQKFIKICVINK